MSNTKPFTIPKLLVKQAWLEVKRNAGSAGVDDETIAKFAIKLEDNLYKIWNRMSSGSYFPEAVKSVSIPKKDGSERILGIPTISDRIAQTVVKLILEPQIDPIFYEDSYGYRPKKSALDAVGITRKRCWKMDWVLEFDIKGLFDNIDHNLLLKAVKCHTKESWIILYIERWLRSPMQDSSGNKIGRSKGTPQGGVISPLLANIFMHYAFDVWISKNHPDNPWCRYADDGLIHLKSEKSAQSLLLELKSRFLECGLELHPDKTKIVYCKDNGRKKEYSNTKFEFLGYEFRGRLVKVNKSDRFFMSFSPAVSKNSLKSMQDKLRSLSIFKMYSYNLSQLSQVINPIIQGWINYYYVYGKSELNRLFRQLNLKLFIWLGRKYKKLRGRKIMIAKFVERIRKSNPELFAHWRLGSVGRFV